MHFKDYPPLLSNMQILVLRQSASRKNPSGRVPVLRSPIADMANEASLDCVTPSKYSSWRFCRITRK
jgi:hypothetical protein